MRQATLICCLILISLSGCMSRYYLDNPENSKDITVCNRNGHLFTNSDPQCFFSPSCALMCVQKQFSYYAGSCKFNKNVKKLLKGGCKIAKKCTVQCPYDEDKQNIFRVTKKNTRTCKFKGDLDKYYKKQCRITRNCRLVCPKDKGKNRKRGKKRGKKGNKKSGKKRNQRAFSWFEFEE